MTLRIRALIAALIVVAVAAAGTFYIRQRAIAVAGPRGVDVAMNGGLADVLGQPPPDGPQLARMAVRDLQEVYYKPVDGAAVVKGESDSLRDFLRTKHVAQRDARATTQPARMKTGPPKR